MPGKQHASRRYNRRAILKGAVATTTAFAAAGFPTLLAAQRRRITIERPLVAALNGKEGDPTDIAIRLIPRILREKHNVALDIDIHASSTLGTDLSQLEAVQLGQIDITSHTTSQFTTFHPAFAFLDLPFVIPDWDTALRLFASDLWREQAAKFEAAVPLKVLPPVGAGGFRLLWNNVRPVPEPAALAGLRIRSSNAALEMALLRAWGATPMPLPWVNVEAALKQRTIDGFHVQPVWTHAFAMYEQLKYATAVNALFAVQLQVMNAKTWAALPEAVQTAFLAAAAEAAVEANKRDRATEAGDTKRLADKGMLIHAPSPGEQAKWQVAGKNLWQSATGIDRDVLERAAALARPA